MYRVICMIFILVMIFSNQALASGFTLNVHVIHQNDNTTCGELWYNNKVIWRIAILANGAKPVLSSYGTATTLIVPDIIDGMFLIKIQ